MTDRELLEAAAKAAGIDCGAWHESGSIRWRDGVDIAYWDPLGDDGDALRLAVKLQLQLHIEGYGSGARKGATEPWALARNTGDAYRAARRAIVQAAAALATQKD